MAIWYYAKNDQQHGPVSEDELRSLIASGSVQAGDEVWCEGMSQWRPAGELPELYGEQPVAPPPIPTAARRGGGVDLPAALHFLGSDLLHACRPLGIWLLVGGFLLVIAAKGCDAIGQRYAERIKSKAVLARGEFAYDYDSRQARLEIEREEINDKAEISERDQKRLETIDEALADLREERDKKQSQLSRTTWQRLRHAADTADASRVQWALWHTVAFVLGSLVLTVGLLIVGLTGQGAQSWLCLGILAIITFSIFVGGVAWIGRFLP